jgi:hypothetical protein
MTDRLETQLIANFTPANFPVTKEAAAALWNTACKLLSFTTLGVGTDNPAFTIDCLGVGIRSYNYTTTDRASFIGEVNGSLLNGCGISLRRLGVEMGGIDADYYLGMRFYVTNGAGAAATQRMQLDASGRLGIGKAPTVVLDVQGNTWISHSASPALLVERTTTATTGSQGANRNRATTSGDMADTFGPTISFSIQDSAAVDNVIGNIGVVRAGADNTGDMVFTTYAAGSGSEKARITSAGLVGVGMTPAHQLDLSTDDARKLTTTTWATGSDERLKTDIEVADYGLCLANVRKLDLKRWAWREDLDAFKDTPDKHMLGFIAQDVEQIFSKAVTQADEHGIEGCRSLNVDQIYKTMFGAVKALIVENDALKARIEALEAR